MTCANQSDTVKQWLAERGALPAFEPFAEYDPAGDCIEFFVSNVPFYGKRLDGWVTAYYCEATNELVGGLIKGVVTSLLPRFPGIRVDIHGDQVAVGFLLRAPAYQETSQEKQRVYKAMIAQAEDAAFQAKLPVPA
jgi:hypothetical protein